MAKAVHPEASPGRHDRDYLFRELKDTTRKIAFDLSNEEHLPLCQCAFAFKPIEIKTGRDITE